MNTTVVWILALVYLVALALELTRIWFRSSLRGAALVGVVLGGLIVHTALVGYRWVALGRDPFSSTFDWCLLAAWALGVVYLYLTLYHPNNPLGIFLLPLVLVLVLAAATVASQVPFAQAQEAQILATVHGLSLLVGTVVVFLGLATGVMYLISAIWMRRMHRPVRLLRLPSLEWLQRITTRCLLLALVCLSLGFVTGLVLSQLRHGHVDWSDPVVWSSSLLVGWLAAVAVFILVYRPARQGRKVAYLTLASFVFLLIALWAFWSTPGHVGKLPTLNGSAPEGSDQLTWGRRYTRGSLRFPLPRRKLGYDSPGGL